MRYLSLIQLAEFKTYWHRLGLTDGDLRLLEAAIMVEPMASPVMKGTGGLRKIRYAPLKSGGGKSGGVRVCYAYFPEFDLIYLCAVFPKNAKANLSAGEASIYKAVLQRFAQYLRANYRSKGITP